MNIYFAGSIRGGRDDQELYSEIVNLLSGYGRVLTEHVGNKEISIMGEGEVTRGIHKRDMDWLAQSDVVIAEITTPSLGVGYEIAKAEEMGKNILCIFRPQIGKSISAMISGSDKLKLRQYKNLEEANIIIKEFLKK